ncbi:hypothetical protein FRB91_007359, partial [Serendipita sp. 411]
MVSPEPLAPYGLILGAVQKIEALINRTLAAVSKTIRASNRHDVQFVMADVGTKHPVNGT